MLEIKNFSKSYGDKKVVDNLSISVQPGDIYGFIYYSMYNSLGCLEKRQR